MAKLSPGWRWPGGTIENQIKGFFKPVLTGGFADSLVDFVVSQRLFLMYVGGRGGDGEERREKRRESGCVVCVNKCYERLLSLSFSLALSLASSLSSILSPSLTLPSLSSPLLLPLPSPSPKVPEGFVHPFNK